MVPEIQDRSLLRATVGNLTALSDGEKIVVINADTLAVSDIVTHQLPQTDEELTALLKPLSTADRGQLPRLPQTTATFEPLVSPSTPGRLSRLTLNIANSCNLWCSYCYADHGTYHAPVSVMSPQAAVVAVSKCVDLYPNISKLQFFGGEPLMNPKAIKAVCEHLRNKLGSACPTFNVTTNGTILNNEIEDIFKRYDFALTISLDGPKEIHDSLRPTREGESSYETILSNLQRLRNIGVGHSFECTFTKSHIDLGYSVIDLLKFFGKEIGDQRPHIAWAALPQPGQQAIPESIFRGDHVEQSERHIPVAIAVEEFRAATRFSMDNIKRGHGAALSSALRFLVHIQKRQKTVGYCPAFFSQVSIATNGDVYPCFMFIGDGRFKMGNILNGSFPGDRWREVQERYHTAFSRSATGTAEWYSNIISGCVASDYITSGSLDQRIYEPVYVAMIEEVLLGIADINQSN